MRNRYLLVADVAAIATAAYAAFGFRFGWLFLEARPEFPLFFVTALVTKVSAFLAFGLYRRYWRYAGFWDLVSLVLANSAAAVVLAILMVAARMAGLIEGLPRTVLPLDWVFALSLTAGIRASVRAIAETASRKAKGNARKTKHVLVAGAGDAGAMVVREMQRNPHLGLKPVALLDDDPEKQGRQIHGLTVVGRLDAVGVMANEYHIDEVIIALPRVGGAAVRVVVEQCSQIGIPSRVMPGIFELLDGKVSVSRLRNVEISDLLRRPQIDGDGWSGAYLAGATVLVTGAGGSIGSELCRQVAALGPARLVLLGHGENSIFAIAAELRERFQGLVTQDVIADVRDRDRISRIVRRIRPDVIFHAAAHKHVPLMEGNPSEAITNNVCGTRNVVDAAVAAGTGRFVLVSTDKAAAPANIMGASKRVAELIVRDAAVSTGRPFVVVRFGNVLGSRGSVVPTFRAQIERGGPVTVTHKDVRRYFMTIPEAVHLILQAGELGRGGELFVLDMGEPVRLLDLANDMITLSGADPAEVRVEFTGLRPGEKLDEILWEDDAVIEPTRRPDIRLVRERHSLASSAVDALIDRLERAALRDDRAAIVTALREALPSADPRLLSEAPSLRSVDASSGDAVGA
jgi:FlaA1/EpsC-like NDP-sugar epimerase